jgi:hypothetical protein
MRNISHLKNNLFLIKTDEPDFIGEIRKQKEDNDDFILHLEEISGELTAICDLQDDNPLTYIH